MSAIEPFLDENVVWSGGVPHKVIHGKRNYLDLMKKVFNSLRYSKNSYKADVVMMKGDYYALVTVDGEYQDLAHFIEIEEGLKRLQELGGQNSSAVHHPLVLSIKLISTKKRLLLQP